MADGEDVSADDFAALVAAGASALFAAQYKRYASASRGGESFKVFRGGVSAPGPWKAPGLHTLVVGDLDVDGLVDLANPYDEGFDEGGLFIVLGNVRCRSFVGEGGKCVFVDGDLIATETIVNVFADSALVVVGDLRTRFFYGIDMGANVGGRAEIEAGDGYCLPLDGVEADWEEVRPRLDEEASLALLRPGLAQGVRDDIGQLLGILASGDEIRERLSRGESIFVDG